VSGELAVQLPAGKEITYAGPTGDQIRRLMAGVAQIRENILAKQPDATGAEVGGLFDAYGEAVWKPSRDPAQDYSRWGRWEAWQFQKPAELGARLEAQPSWVVWDSESGQVIGFEPGRGGNARYKAEVFAVALNDGKPTRVVPAAGGFAMAGIGFAEARALIADAEAKALEAAGG